MSGGLDLGTSHSGRRKPLDVAINLVPFIDLMAVTIAFLIMTAVWTQVGRLQVAEQGGSGRAESKAELPVSVLVTPKEVKVFEGTLLEWSGALKRDNEGSLSTGELLPVLERLSEKDPDRVAVTIQVEDGVKYDDLVRVVDVCLTPRKQKGPFEQALFPGVSVQPAQM